MFVTLESGTERYTTCHALQKQNSNVCIKKCRIFVLASKDRCTISVSSNQNRAWALLHVVPNNETKQFVSSIGLQKADTDSTSNPKSFSNSSLKRNVERVLKSPLYDHHKFQSNVLLSSIDERLTSKEVYLKVSFRCEG